MKIIFEPKPYKITGIVNFFITWAICSKEVFIYIDITVPDVEMGYCLGSDGNGDSMGKGGEGGPAPQEEEKISSQCSTKAETTWAGTRKTNQVGRDEGGSTQQSEQPSEQVKLCKYENWVLILISFFLSGE